MVHQRVRDVLFVLQDALQRLRLYPLTVAPVIIDTDEAAAPESPGDRPI